MSAPTALTIRIDKTGGPSEWGDQDTIGTLLDENDVLFSHFSSSVAWLIRDLTSNFGRNVELAAKYPDGWCATLDGEVVASWTPKVVGGGASNPSDEET